MHLFLLDVAPLEEVALFTRALALLSPARRAKTLALRRPEDQRLSLGAGLVLRHGLAALGCTEALVGIEPAATGKPLCTLRPHIQFNLAHSGSLVAGVFAETCPVGVDVETITSTDIEALSQQFFHPHERAWLLQQDTAQRNRSFFRLWTRKESCLKAAGCGFATHSAAFATLPAQPEGIFLEGTRWHVREYPLTDDYALAVCASRPHFAEAPVWLHSVHVVSNIF